MAEEVREKIEEQLNCSICLDTYTDPRLLQCCHVYCQKCLEPLVVRDQQGQLGLTCPTCRQVTPIPDRGVAGLQPAFHINQLLEIKKYFAPSCFEHHKEELKLYCETCGELVCIQCVMKGGKHHNHDCAVLEKAFDRYKKEIASSLEPMEKKVMDIKKTLAQLDARCGEISDQQTVTEDNIHITFRRLQEGLNVRETKLIGRLHQLTREKLKDLAVQRDEIEAILAQLCSCLHSMRESLRLSNEGESDVLMMKTNTVKQVEELITPFEPDIDRTDVVFSAATNMTEVCQKYEVFSPDLPDPSKYHSKLAVQLAAKKLSTSIIRIDDPTGVAVNQKGEVIVTDWGENCVSVFSPSGEKLLSFGNTGTGQGEFCGPRGVAVDSDGNILVTDPVNHRIQKFTAEGKFLAAVGTEGSGPLQFSYPSDISNSTNKVYVVDSGNHRVQVLNSDLTFSSTFGEYGVGKGQFKEPWGVACDSTGKVYVADRKYHHIQVFTANGRLLRMFRGYGQSTQLAWHNGIAIDTNDMVYVSDGWNYRVSVFTSEGHFVTSFGKELGSPRGIAVDDEGVMYVCYGFEIRIFC